jgi:hypothetical protein
MKLKNGMVAVLLVIAIAMSLVPVVSAEYIQYGVPYSLTSPIMYVSPYTCVPGNYWQWFSYWGDGSESYNQGSSGNSNGSAPCGFNGIAYMYPSGSLHGHTISQLHHITIKAYNGSSYEDPSTWASYYITPEVFLRYANFTINVKSNTTGMNVPRVDVILRSSSTSTLEGKTDLEGNITFGLVGVLSNYQPIINVSKAGYNTSSITIADNLNTTPEIYRSISLNDVALPPGGSATVYLDIADVDTGMAITGATVGIQNTTATIDQWTYGTYAGSTILFNKTGVVPPINLSVGQNIAFAGYKSGGYEANNTGTYQIPSPISHLELLLKKVVGNTSAHYHYPVTITDATTGNAIGDSTLKTAFWSGGIHSNYYNSTSATGKFNVTGVGPGGQTPLKLGDIVLLYGNATGYEPSGFYLTVDDETNGVTQYVNLAPSSLVPLSGEFTALVEAYDADTTQALQGVSVVVRKGGNSTSATTGASGIAKFKNLTAGDPYSLTATKTGYTQLTKTFMGGSGLIVTIDAAMSSVGVNPTYSITTTPTSNASAGAMNEKGAAGLIQLIDYLIMVSGMVFVGLMIIFGAKVVRAVRDALGI